MVKKTIWVYNKTNKKYTGDHCYIEYSKIHAIDEDKNNSSVVTLCDKEGKLLKDKNDCPIKVQLISRKLFNCRQPKFVIPGTATEVQAPENLEELKLIVGDERKNRLITNNEGITVEMISTGTLLKRGIKEKRQSSSLNNSLNENPDDANNQNMSDNFALLRNSMFPPTEDVYVAENNIWVYNNTYIKYTGDRCCIKNSNTWEFDKKKRLVVTLYDTNGMPLKDNNGEPIKVQSLPYKTFIDRQPKFVLPGTATEVPVPKNLNGMVSTVSKSFKKRLMINEEGVQVEMVSLSALRKRRTKENKKNNCNSNNVNNKSKRIVQNGLPLKKRKNESAEGSLTGETSSYIPVVDSRMMTEATDRQKIDEDLEFLFSNNKTISTSEYSMFFSQSSFNHQDDIMGMEFPPLDPG